MSSELPSIADLAAFLTDASNAERMSAFPTDPSRMLAPGVYTLWVDEAGREQISRRLKADLPSLIYLGQAGATRWPSGTPSDATLVSRIRGNHLRGRIRGSTFRYTLASILLDDLTLRVEGSKVLTAESERSLSGWMERHLSVVAAPYDDADRLQELDKELLQLIDPPLNLNNVDPTPLRVRVRELRRRIQYPAS
ncbi:MAG TPA: hypothetical protein ENK19_01185 [Acidobacteria bacterium]|nr:hypothetical protein [Acidobacteriota bacterium]